MWISTRRLEAIEAGLADVRQGLSELVRDREIAQMEHTARMKSLAGLYGKLAANLPKAEKPMESPTKGDLDEMAAIRARRTRGA
jgi:hypothetical protein